MGVLAALKSLNYTYGSPLFRILSALQTFNLVFIPEMPYLMN